MAVRWLFHIAHHAGPRRFHKRLPLRPHLTHQLGSLLTHRSQTFAPPRAALPGGWLVGLARRWRLSLFVEVFGLVGHQKGMSCCSLLISPPSSHLRSYSASCV